jgi:uncharacterized protein
VNSIRINRLGVRTHWLARFADSLALIRRASHALYPRETLFHRWRRVRLWLRSMVWWNATIVWLRQCEISPLRDIVWRDPIVYERMHRPFLHGRFDARKRLAASLDHQTFTMREAPRLAAQIARDGYRKIAHIERGDERWTVTLESIERFCKEGDWTLCIRDSEGRRVVSCTFSFAYLGGKRSRVRMCIGSVQGADSPLNGRELFRALTKRWYGLRPKVFVIYLAQCVASAMNAQGTLLVSTRSHIYSSWRYCLRKRRVAADYDELSRECGALAHWRNWHVLTPPARYVAGHLSDRGGNAMRRKRHELRTSLAMQIDTSVGRG